MAQTKARQNSGKETAEAKRTEDDTAGTDKTPPEFTIEEEFRAYRDMLLIRRFEEKAGQLYGMGFIGGFCHLYIGQEAVVVGMQITGTCSPAGWTRAASWPS
jgi:pyruvate dehydrogenase E1 component alpha subunit